ncbi:MAG: glycosyltransferase, partial [Eggerthellaceae bacterium]|nr:glycosyltransferase [Eggerthellaceae bacterium]
MQTTLQTILLPTEERYLECPGLFYRPGALNIPGPDVLPYGKYARWAGGFFPGEPLPVASTNTDRVSFDFKKQALYVAEDNTVSLCTYFNMLSMRKWLSYTYVEDFAVELDLKGEGEIIIYELAAPDVGEHRQYLWGATSQVVKRVPFSCKRRQKVNIPINMSTTTCVGVDIQASTAVSFFGGRWLGQVEAEQVRPVDICILTTTFQKEEYITANLKLLQEGIWSTATQARKAKEIPCDIAEHLDVIVVDNGKTLEAAQVENEHVSLFPNDNVGGAGGFARGMIEALRSGKNYTHALIMDDDISMHPEAFRRTYTLLRLLRPEFENIYIAGAMLQLDCPNTQHEDIGYIHRNGYFTPRKGRLDLYDVRVCVQNEVLWDPIYNQYAAWWYCCVPMRDVREDNLPLPFFVRGDDVE